MAGGGAVRDAGGVMDVVRKNVEGLTGGLAMLGGIVLCGVAIITVVSITGRALIWAGLAPVPGDFELVEAGTGFAVFAFLGWCHLRREHASVEILADRFGPMLNRLIDVVVDALMLLAASVIAVQHFRGTLDKYAFGETSYILSFPLWWAYAAGLVGAAGFVVAALYCLGGSLGRIGRTGRGEAKGPTI